MSAAAQQVGNLEEFLASQQKAQRERRGSRLAILLRSSAVGGRRASRPDTWSPFRRLSSAKAVYNPGARPRTSALKGSRDSNGERISQSSDASASDQPVAQQNGAKRTQFSSSDEVHEVDSFQKEHERPLELADDGDHQHNSDSDSDGSGSFSFSNHENGSPKTSWGSSIGDCIARCLPPPEERMQHRGVLTSAFKK